jgi:hypothetical protein
MKDARPRHPNTANETPGYQIRRKKRAKFRIQRNVVVLAILRGSR